VLDFVNDADGIQQSFAPFYRTTILSRETDPNKLHDLKADLDAYHVYNSDAVDRLVALYLDGAARDRLDPILDACVATYTTTLDEDQQVEGQSKGIHPDLRIPRGRASLHERRVGGAEHLSQLSRSRLPAPVETDLSKGVLESIDMDSYRVEARATMAIALADGMGRSRRSRLPRVGRLQNRSLSV
jgi:type I restriction enzyme R subunit